MTDRTGCFIDCVRSCRNIAIPLTTSQPTLPRAACRQVFTYGHSFRGVSDVNVVHVVNVPRNMVELSLERNFDRTVGQLERVQRMLLGQPVLPKLEVHHSVS